MEKLKKQLPENMVNIMITYKIENDVYTKRGWYNDPKVGFSGYYNALGQWINPPNGYFTIPPSWQFFTIGKKEILLPHGWGGDRVLPENIINWEYCKT